MLLEDIGQYLQSNAVGIVGTDIFYGYLPNSPDDCIVLFEYAGEPSEYAHDGSSVEKPGLQVRVRNVSYSSGRSKIDQIKNVLNLITNRVVGETFYLSIIANQSPIGLGRDTQGRSEFVINFSIKKS